MKISVVSTVARHWRELAGFAVLFRLVESLLFAPLIALAGKWLLDRTVLDSTALVSFLLSARGFLAVLMAAVAALTIRLIEHAGLSLICFGAFDSGRVSAVQAFRIIARHFPTLVRAAARFVAVGLLVVLPLLGVVRGFGGRLLSQHDINYYLKFRPPEFMTAVWVIGMVALGTAVVLLAFIVRWRWVVQEVLFQQKEVAAAFAESAALTLGWRWKLTGALVGVTVSSLALGLTGSWIGEACASLVLGSMAKSATSLVLSFTVLLLLRTVIEAGCTFLGSCLDAGVFTFLYRRRLAALGREVSTLRLAEASPGAPVRRVGVVFAVGLLAFAAAATWASLDAITAERPLTIHAHRGVSTEAPENSLAAVRAAIAAGADYIETDVQLSKDGVLVLAHDSDFSRLGGVAKKVWELTYAEIQAIPLRSQSEVEPGKEVTPTLDALFAEVKDRIKVNIELKYYGDHQPGLARKVVDAVRAHGMLDQVVVQCLEYDRLLEVRELAPEIPIGYLLSFNARTPARLQVDFLSVEKTRVDRSFILGAHRRGQEVYAWTVNTVPDLERLFDLGVDGVITDQAALARTSWKGYSNRSKAERAVRRIRAWLGN